MQQPKILLVDDAPMMTRFLSLFLSEKFAVTIADSAPAALEMLQAGYRPDLIITDLDMPEMSGIALIRQIRDIHPNIPMVVISGMKESRFRLDALEAGADDYLTKPFHPAELSVRLQKQLNKTRPAEPLTPRLSHRRAVAIF
jgi:two-component system KDP operon response regulator KdpE